MASVAPAISPSGLTFAQFQSRGISGHLEALIAANLNATASPSTAPTIVSNGAGRTLAAPSGAITGSANGGGATIAAPTTAATLSATGGASSGGSLAATTYYVAYTWVTACGGETTVGTSQASVVVAAGDIPSVTIPALPSHVASANIYVGTVSGTLYLYKKGITGTECFLDSSTWYGGGVMLSAPAAPTINTTTGVLPPGAYYAAITQYHAHGETTVGTSVTGAAFTVTANAAPSGAPTGAATTGTGSLPTASTGYYYQVTYVDSNGLETAGTENSVVTALSSTGEITVTFHDTAPDWVKSRNLYLTAPNGASGTETLYATGISPTATTYVANSASWTNGTTTQAAAKAVPTSGTSAAVVPSLTLPGAVTGAVGMRVYLSNTGGTNTAFGLHGATTATTYYLTGAPWNGLAFASAVAPPGINTTVGALVAGTYYAKNTETEGTGETTATSESLSFTVTANAAPSGAPTGAGSGSSGHLAAGAYYYQVTYVDTFGNETAGTENAVATTITAGQSLVITLNDTAPDWVASRNVYLSAAGGASGSETLYATGISAAASSCTASSASWTNGTTTQAAAKAVPTSGTSAAQVAQLTFPSPLQAGNTARNVYLTPAGGASGGEVLYATGVVGATFDAAVAAPTNTYAASPPAANTTALSTNRLQLLRYAKTNQLQRVWDFHRQLLSNYDRGDPQAYQDVVQKLRDAQLVYVILAQLAAEQTALLDADPGHFTAGQNGIGNATTRRQWAASGQ